MFNKIITDIETAIYFLGSDKGIIYIEENKKNEITSIVLSGDHKDMYVSKDVFFDLLYKHGYIQQCTSHYTIYYQMSKKGEKYYNFKYPK